ncbi:hypothetical protein [Capillimicrobium parvum]|uniref:Uncharacterized protein n=1 Tax=Capillimicrobium parvum TaxID=2884022 RepID=A0A9E6XZT7_9ACTN|nr:hypothetical protein [Capillimicrobium parvum]UGS37058.1 hypothetical protein DSM104329_03470 [Capillimicrobium parvum]
MNVEAIAPMPHSRLAWRLTDLRARRHRRRLDRALAAGQDPWTSGELVTRAAELTALPTRRKLAHAIADMIVIADHTGHVASAVTYSDVCRAPIREERDRLVDLAHLLHGTAPVPVACVAAAAGVLWHDADALRDPAHAADALEHGLNRCFDVIRHSAPTGLDRYAE